MAVTLVSAVMVMAAYFLLLYAVVGFIQDKKFFSTAPKENLAVIPDKKERFSRRSYHWLDNSCDRYFAVRRSTGCRCMGRSKKRIWLSAILWKICHSALYYGAL